MHRAGYTSGQVVHKMGRLFHLKTTDLAAESRWFLHLKIGYTFFAPGELGVDFDRVFSSKA
jgi:hypothetical protein